VGIVNAVELVGQSFDKFRGHHNKATRDMSESFSDTRSIVRAQELPGARSLLLTKSFETMIYYEGIR
jgi:hypothetical protein